MSLAHRPAYRLELRQGQSLVMTQQLQQSIKLLQMNGFELQAYIDQALEQNPLLTQDETEPQPETPLEAAGDMAGSAQESSEPGETDLERDDYAGENSATETWEENADEAYLRHDQRRETAGGHSADEDMPDASDSAARDVSLRDHLLTQLNVAVADPVRRMIGWQLIDAVDEAGYIKDDITQIAGMLGAEIAQVEEMLGLLQRFDPVGVCARDLRECLALQLREKDRLDPAMELLLDNLALLGAGQMAELQKRCGVDLEDLREMIAEIRALNPKPGGGFTHEIVQTAAPDVFVQRLPDGGWHVELNTSAMPRVMVDRRYYIKLSSNARRGEDKKYLSDQLGHASWLIKALDQRAQTLLKVSSELVKRQDGFFRLGVRYLKPLTLKDIAAEIGVHESTVSRVTTGKFIQSSRGNHEMKYFFTSALQHASGGEDVSSETVRYLIKELIGAETAQKILSDDDLVELLKAKNINVARRTVAKYREGMGIPSSLQRRRMKLSAV